MSGLASFARTRAFLDQLERSQGLAAERITATRADLASAEKLTGRMRQQALKKLATQVTTDARAAADRPKVRMLSTAITELVSLP